MVTTLVILILAVVAFVSNKVAPPIVALAVALALFVTGTVSTAEAIAGFGDPVVVYLAALYVVSEALDATGVTARAGQQLLRRVGGNRLAVLATLMVLCAALTALISVNGAVAALVPVAVMLATRIGEPPSQILMPLAFAAHAGSMLTLLGTPVNVLVSELSVEAGGRPFGFFEFGLVGVPLLVGTVVIALLMGRRVLPVRQPENARRDLSRHAETLAAHYAVHDEQTTISHHKGVTEGAMVAVRVIPIPQAQHAISLPTLLIVAGMVPLSTAMQTSGLADVVSDGLLAILGNSSPLLLQLGIVGTVVVLGQFISNLATVLIVSPIAMTVAATADVSPLPLLMGITVAGAASFITPVATAANLMIQEPGAYRFGDYWKLGLPNLVLFVLVATLLVPAIWPF